MSKEMHRIDLENGDYYGPSPAASYSTKALPGTEEKIRVLTARAASGQCLWHKEDGRITDQIERRLRRRFFEIKTKHPNLEWEVAMRQAREEISEELVWSKT